MTKHQSVGESYSRQIMRSAFSGLGARIGLSWVLLLVFVACQNEKRKPVVHKTKPKVVAVEEPPIIYFEKITNKNVVERLTTYGKENPETVFDVFTTKGKIRIRLFKDTPTSS